MHLLTCSIERLVAITRIGLDVSKVIHSCYVEMQSAFHYPLSCVAFDSMPCPLRNYMSQQFNAIVFSLLQRMAVSFVRRVCPIPGFCFHVVQCGIAVST
jgi:hypothetical protein